MIRVAAIVEGYGDVKAVPALVAKTAAFLGKGSISIHPIRAGEWKSLRRLGELETFLSLAASRQPELVLVMLDLEDDCVKDEADIIKNRINAWLNGRTIKVEPVFLDKEYETLFLHNPSCFGRWNSDLVPEHPDNVRGAKECVKAIIGRKYKETQDQLRFTQSLDLKELYLTSRAFRRLCKAVTGNDYDVLDALVR